MKQAQEKRQSKSMTPLQDAQEDDREPSKRPPGRKQSKQKQKRNDGEDEYAVQLATFIQMKSEEHQKCEERWKTEKDLEERKLLWDQEQKIMFCNTSNMDESQIAYVKAMRQQIATAKDALFKASGGEAPQVSKAAEGTLSLSCEDHFFSVIVIIMLISETVISVICLRYSV